MAMNTDHLPEIIEWESDDVAPVQMYQPHCPCGWAGRTTTLYGEALAEADAHIYRRKQAAS